MLGPVIIGRIPAAAVEYEGLPLDVVIDGLGTGEVIKRAVDEIPAQLYVPKYNGSPLQLVLDGWREDAVSITGQTEATDAGTYMAFATPLPGYWWAADRTRRTIVIEWKIAGISVPVPTLTSDEVTYSGSEQSIPLIYDADSVILSGDKRATDAGDYTVIARLPDANHEWADGSDGPKTYAWRIARKKLAKPALESKRYTYNGSRISPAFANASETGIQASGDLFATDAGDYTAVFEIGPNYEWADGTTAPVEIEWSVACKRVAKPTMGDPIVYTGSAIAAPVSPYDATAIRAEGTDSAINAGTYKMTFEPRPNHEWNDGTSTPIELTWKIEAKAVSKPTVGDPITYTGSQISAPVTGFNSVYMGVDGTQNATNAGTYDLVYTLKPNYKWSDGTVDPVELTWVIEPKAVAKPAVTRSLRYDGSDQAAPVSGYNSAYMEVEGARSATVPGTYDLTYTLKPNYKWSDGTTEPILLTWTMGRKQVAVPTQNTTIIYNGSERTASFSGVDSTAMETGGQLSATDVGSYVAIFTLLPYHEWSDGSTAPAHVTWRIRAKVIQLPTQSNSPRYTGSAQSPTWNKVAEVTMGGTQSATNAGSYEATATLAANCEWPDGTTEPKTITWVIGRKQLAPVTLATTSYTYSGNKVSPAFQNVNASYMDTSGTLSATAAGLYTATFALKANYEWSDGTSAPVSIEWSIGQQVVAVPVQSGSPAYTGSAIEPGWTGYDSALMTKEHRTTDRTNAGTKITRFTLKDSQSYKWSNNSGADYVDVEWVINPKQISRVTLSTTNYTFSGVNISPYFSNTSSSTITSSGTSAVDVGTHTAIFTPKPNYEWAGGGADPISIEWKITKNTSVAIPSQSGSVVYTGSARNANWNGYNANLMTMEQVTTDVTNAGNKTARFTLKYPDSSQWADGSTSTYKDVTWTIGKASVTVPTQKGTLACDGTEKTPGWNNYNTDLMEMTYRTADRTSAGTKTARFTLKDPSNRQWADGTTTSYKDVEWTIGKGTTNITLSKSYVTLLASSIVSGGTTTVDVTCPSTGAVTASSSDSSKATVSVSGRTLTIKGISTGNTTITVNVAGDTNYEKPSAVTISVKINQAAIAQCTAAEVQQIVRAGQAKNHWKAGDMVPRKLSGSASGGIIDDIEAYDVVLDFDHNAEIEGSNTMMMGLCWRIADGKTFRTFYITGNYVSGWNNGGAGPGAVGIYYNAGDGCGDPNSHSFYGTNDGGWQASHMRNSVMPALFAAIEDPEWRAIISYHTVYTSNGAAGQNNTAAEVTATTERIYLLSAYEAGSVTNWSNSYESSKQARVSFIGTDDRGPEYFGSGGCVGNGSRSPISNKDSRFCSIRCTKPTLDNSTNRYGAEAATSPYIHPVYTIA